jgi:hypothetical protein
VLDALMLLGLSSKGLSTAVQDRGIPALFGLEIQSNLHAVLGDV